MLETSPATMSNVCEFDGCSNQIYTNDGRYCCDHDGTKCVTKGCSNTPEFDGSLLCMVCLRSQKLMLRHANASVSLDSSLLLQDKLCIIRGCLNSREFEGSYLCMVCSQSERNRLKDAMKVNKEASDVPKSTSTCENIDESSWRNQSHSLRFTNEKMSNYIFSSSSSSSNSKDALNFTSNCFDKNDIVPKGRKESNMDRWTNSVESNDNSMHLEDQERLSGDMDSNETKPSITCNSRERPSKDVVLQTGNNGFDFTIMAKNLPPIPCMPISPCAGNTNTGKKDNFVGGEVERKVSAKDNNAPIPFDTLPPIPLPLSRSNSNPEQKSPPITEMKRFMSQPPRSLQPLRNCKVLDCHRLAANDLSGYCFNCFTANHSLENVPLTVAARGGIPTVKQNMISKLPSCKFIGRGSNIDRSKDLKSYPARQVCKARDCKYFVNEGLGGYCSECFMCFNIVDNLPPSPTHDHPIDFNFDIMMGGNEDRCSGGASNFKNQLCKGTNCEFFGSDDFDGYCSQCYIPVVRKKDVDEEYDLDGYDDDSKLCIICIQTPYNTVLLPCGHLYLCFECATSVKQKRAKCPACRSHIQSFHRVYTPD